MENNDFSCIEEVTKIVHLTLPSAYNSNEISGICDTLESWKRQYVKQLQGIVVGYKNVSLTSKLGYLKVDCPVIHCNVKATFELFYPVVGSIIKGKINRVSQDHIGCLVHDTINVTVHRTADIASDISNLIVLDCFILFQITRIVIKPKFIHVKGKITEQCATLMRESSMLNDGTEIIKNKELNCLSPDFSNNQSVNDTVTSNCNAQSNSTDTSSQTSSNSRKKKHRRSQAKLEMSPPVFSESLESVLNEVESIQSPTTIKKRKRKRSNDDVTLSTQSSLQGNVENELRHVKKKRKNQDSTSVKQLDSSNISVGFCENKFPGMSPDPHSNKTDVIGSSNGQKVSGDLESSVDLSSQSSSSKKKKHKKSKDSLLMSPSLLSESLDSETNEIEPTQLLDNTKKRLDSDAHKSSINCESLVDISSQTSSSTKKKKHKKSKDKLQILPTALSESLESEVNKIESSLPLDVTRKRKRTYSNHLKDPTHSELQMRVKNELEPLQPKKKRKVEDVNEFGDKINFSHSNELSGIFPGFFSNEGTDSMALSNSKENSITKIKDSVGAFTKILSPTKREKEKSKNSSETSSSIFNESVKIEMNETESMPANMFSKKELKNINTSSTSPTLYNELVITQEKSENDCTYPVTVSPKKKHHKLNDLQTSTFNELSVKEGNKSSHSKKEKKHKKLNSKNKTHKKKKGKKKEGSKKDKKKKSKDKVISTKKKVHGYKVKSKKKSKDKHKKLKKSKSKEKAEIVP